MAIGDGFRKIDADAVNANQPLDAFALQGVAENLTLARDNRTRRIAVGWPADVRPVMAAHDLVAYPLCMWPVSSYAKEVTIEVRHAVTDAPVHMGLATIYSGRLNKRVEDLTEVAVSTTTTTLTLDVSSYANQEIPLFLVVISEGKDDAQTVTIDGATDGNIITGHGKVHLPTGHGLTILQNAGDRWRCNFDPAASGSANVGDETYPGMRTVILVVDAANDAEIWVWPRFAESSYPEPGWSLGNYKFTVETIGKSTVKGISIYESDVRSFDPNQDKILPARSPVALHIGELYRKGRIIHRDHTTVHHAGPTWDPEQKDSASDVISGGWGEGPVSVTTSYQTIGSCWVGNYAQNNIEGGTARDRDRLQVSGMLYVCPPHRYFGYGYGEPGDPPQIPGKIKALVYSYDGVGNTWTSFVSTSAEIDFNISTMPHNTWHLMGFTTDANRFHYLRGAVDYHEVTGGVMAGLIPFSFEIQDGRPADTQRTLQLQAKMEVGSVYVHYVLEMHCVTLTVRNLEGVYGT